MAQDVTQNQYVTLENETESQTVTPFMSENVIMLSHDDLNLIGDKQPNMDHDTNDKKYYVEIVTDSSEDEIDVSHKSIDTCEANVEEPFEENSPVLLEDSSNDDDVLYIVAKDNDDNDVDNDLEDNFIDIQNKSNNYNIKLEHDKYELINSNQEIININDNVEQNIDISEDIVIEDTQEDVKTIDTLILNKEAISNPKQYIRKKLNSKVQYNHDSNSVMLENDVGNNNIKADELTNECIMVGKNHGNVQNDNKKGHNAIISVADEMDINQSITIEKTEVEKRMEELDKNNIAQDNKSVIEPKEVITTNIKEEIIKIDADELIPNVQDTIKDNNSLKTNELESIETSDSVAVDIDTTKRNWKDCLNIKPFYYKVNKPSVTYLKKVQKAPEMAIEQTPTVFPTKVLTLKIREDLKDVTTDIDYNSLMQDAFYNNRHHFNLKSYKKKRILYKCYACKIGFVHLYPFETHLRSLHSKEKLNIAFEITLNQLFMIASRKNTETFENVPIYDDDGNLVHICTTCLKCVQDLDEHQNNKICVGCFQFLDCTQFEKHVITCTNYFKVTFPKTCLCKIILDGYYELEMHHKECSMGAKTLLFQCFVCKYIYQTASMLQQHQLTEHIVRSDEFELPIGTKQCKLCKTFLKPYDYHDCPEENRRFMCKHCLKQFTQKSAYQIHEDNLKADVQCEYCSVKVKFECQMMRHLALKHDCGYSVVFMCNICDFRLDSESQIKYHMLNMHTMSAVEKQVYTYRVLVVRKSTHPAIESDNEKEMHEYSAATKKVSKSGTYRKKNSTSDPKRKTVSKNDSKKEEISENDNKKEEISENDNKKEEISENDTVSNDSDDDYTPSRRKSPRILRRKTKKKKKKAVKVETSQPLKQKEIEFEVPIIDSKEELKEVLLTSLKENETIQHNDNKEISDIDAFIQNNSEITLSFHDRKNKQKPRLLQCEYCSYITKHSIALKVHTKKKHNKIANLLKAGLEKSILEDKEFSHLYRKKYTRSQNKPRYRCKYCTFVTVQKNKIKKHENNCNENAKTSKKAMLYKETNINCVCDCGETFNDLHLFLIHLDHEKNEYPCPFCQEKLFDLNKTASHVQKHFKSLFINSSVLMEDRTYKIIRCITCDKPVRPSEFYMHYKNHNNDIRKQIEGLVQSDDNNSDEDITKTAEDITKNNEECDVTITPVNPYDILSEENMNDIINILKKPLRYERLSMKNNFFKISCLVCGKEFLRRNDYKRHLIQHLLLDAIAKIQSDLGLKCQICNLIFDKIAKYKKHMRDHSYLPQYICSSCNKSFSDSSNFAKHKKVHNVNVSVCDVCHKKFTTKTTLQQHMNSHESQKPMVCKCKKIFYDQSQYRKHLRMKHTLDSHNKYPCHLCTDSFSTLKEKWTHLWIIHQCCNQLFVCPFCEEMCQFRLYQDFKHHVLFIHHQRMTLSKATFLKLVEQYKEGEVALEDVNKLFTPDSRKGLPTPPIKRFTVTKGLVLS